MFTWTWIFGIVLFGTTTGVSCAADRETHNLTTCEEFERDAKFNPYLVIESTWKIFYFWANTTEVYPIIFSLPAKNRLDKFKDTIEAVYPGLGVEWDKATLFMQPRPGTEVLMLHATTPGAFRALVKQEQRKKVRPQPAPLIKFADIRMKLVNQYIGMMCCEDLTAYALARIHDLPPTEETCEMAASTIGYKGRNGRSYLYLNRIRNDEL